MKHDIVPAWMWRSPGDIIEELLALSQREFSRQILTVPHETKRGADRDRYYTMARRAQIRAYIRRLHG